MNQFKIGLTTQTPEQRARELSRATGVPQPFEVAYSVYIADCFACERLVHQKLGGFHTGKEFFAIPLAVAVQTVNEVADIVGRADPDGKSAEKTKARNGNSIQGKEIDFSAPGFREPARADQLLQEQVTVTFEQHFEKADPLGKEILLEIRQRALALGADVNEKVTRFNRIAYSRGRIFLEVKVHKDRVRVLFLDIALDDPRRLVEIIPETYGLGRLKYSMNLRSLDDLAYAMPYIEASYRVALD